MDEKANQTNQEALNNLFKCPHCSCCFCNEADLKKHVESFGVSQLAHQQEFNRVHGSLEHASMSGPE